MGGQLLHEILWSFVFLSLCSAQCTFPTSLRGSWLSSEIGANELEFASSSFSGYTVYTYGTFNFTCEIKSGTKYVVKSETFQRFGLDFNAYMCLDLTEIITDADTGTSTGQLYKYYKATDELRDAGYERVKIWLSSKQLNTYTQICTVTDYTNVPYSMLLANDTIQNNTISCPIPFLGVFGYTYDTGSGNLCSANSSNLDVCTDKTTMTWNYTQCSQIQAYSSGGVVNCLYYTEDNTGNDTVYTLHVYNQDATVDQSTNYRFTCYKVTGYGTVYATQSPGDCVAGQNETYVTSPGGTLVLTASVLCAYDIITPSSSPAEVLSAGAIAGIVIGCLIIIIAIIVFFGFRWYRKREREKQEAWEAANRKVDPDELSPNMRLGLPDESKYDLDRLMYSPIDEKSEKKKFSKKNGTVKGKGSRRSMKLKVPTDRMESYNEGDYMDEGQRQTAMDATLFTEKRKRKDGKDEFKANDPKNKQYADRVKEIAKGKRRPFKLAALAKLRLRPKAKPMLGDPSEKTDGVASPSKDIVIQVEEAEVENKRRTRFADEEPTPEQQKKAAANAAKKVKALEDIDTLSDIVDNELGVNDLSDEEKEPRLKLPNLNPKKPDRKKRSQDKYSLVSGNQRTSAMPLNTKFMPPKSKLQTEESFIEPMPLIRNAPNLSSMPPLQRIHRKESSNFWKTAIDNANGGRMDMEELKKGMSENQWRKLLEELYRDKKYFDYVKKTSSKNETELGGMADDGLQFLYGRAMFWEEQQPIPARPPTSLRKLYSRHDSTRGSERRAKSSAGLHRSNTGIKRSASLKRSATTLSGKVKGSGYGYKTVPRTPSTQVSRLRRREGKQAKHDANKNDDSMVPNGGPKLAYFDGGTQTEFSPPISPLLLTDTAIDFSPGEQIERMSLPGSVILEEEGQSVDSRAPSGTFIHPPPKPIQKEVTKSDIKLEEVDNDIDNDYNYGAFGDEEVTIAI